MYGLTFLSFADWKELVNIVWGQFHLGNTIRSAPLMTRNEARGPNVDIGTFYVLSSPQIDPNDYFWSAMLKQRGPLIVK